MGRTTQGASFALDAGVLHIAASGIEMRLQWQPEPLAEQRVAGGRWYPFIPAFRLLAPPGTMCGAADAAVEAKYATLLAFRAGIPADLAEVVEPFQSHQWPLLHMLWASPAARDLARSNRVLAYAMAANHELRATPQAVAAGHAARHCHQKQRVMARWLGFNDSEAMVRLFRKVPLDLASPGLLRLLRNAAGIPEGLRMLGHLPAIHTGILHLLGQRTLARLAGWPLIQEVAASADERETAVTADALVEALAMLGDLLALGTPEPFISIRQVLAFREAVAREWGQRRRPQERLRVRGHGLAWVALPRPPAVAPAGAGEAPVAQRRAAAARRPAQPVRSQGSFPEPPVRGTDAIVPLRTPDQLVAEGQAQHNCVGAYSGLVRNGSCYIYRVLAPERATLSIVPRGAGAWSVGQLKAACNRSVRADTIRAVRQWLDAAQVSL